MGAVSVSNGRRTLPDLELQRQDTSKLYMLRMVRLPFSELEEAVLTDL